MQLAAVLSRCGWGPPYPCATAGRHGGADARAAASRRADGGRRRRALAHQRGGQRARGGAAAHARAAARLPALPLAAHHARRARAAGRLCRGAGRVPAATAAAGASGGDVGAPAMAWFSLELGCEGCAAWRALLLSLHRAPCTMHVRAPFAGGRAGAAAEHQEDRRRGALLHGPPGAAAPLGACTLAPDLPLALSCAPRAAHSRRPLPAHHWMGRGAEHIALCVVWRCPGGCAQVQGVLSSAGERWPHVAISDSLVMADTAVNMAKAGCK